MNRFSAYFLALIWGISWALCLETRPGKWLAYRRTWLTVVVGVGVDLLIAITIMPRKEWAKFTSIIGLSSIGIILRSLLHEYGEENDH